jgi:hypothetical protein
LTIRRDSELRRRTCIPRFNDQIDPLPDQQPGSFRQQNVNAGRLLCENRRAQEERE